MSESTRRVLGIDPGTNILGFAVIELDQRQVNVLELGVLRLSATVSPYTKLKRIYDRVQELIHTFHPREMAIEAPFYGNNVQSMLKLGRAQGVAIAAAISIDLEVTEYSPKKVKQSVTGNGNASKEQVAAMLANQLKLDLSGQYLDATDALAVAMCHFYQNKLAGSGQKRYGGWGDFLKSNPDKIG
ncbi:MAG: crossover junction endodeoxyribonuclease RuvC [Saprospiraceae bacterium]|nr:crossover junction endodeoxyribonuclease RuvC [Saprospiraceae bacterium]